uniref:Uncharacterized protein n=1 Tax=Haemonchus contortus TaxID=6289 RepID=A0A7I4YE42_HAECO
MEQAQTLAIELEAKRVSARHHDIGTTTNETVGIAKPKLPAIPVPVFTGKVWEFENFWTLFAANVHKQPLTPLQKFNYLISALRGEARESVRRFTVTEANYEHALTFLRTKYGDESRLISNLQVRLESAKAPKATLTGQRQLLENIIPIVTQLEEKGVSLNGSFLAQKILSKFTINIQRRVLERRMALPTQENIWTIRDILTDIDNIIEIEERINRIVQGSNRPNYIKPQNVPSYEQQTAQQFSLSCFLWQQQSQSSELLKIRHLGRKRKVLSREQQVSQLRNSRTFR